MKFVKIEVVNLTQTRTKFGRTFGPFSDNYRPIRAKFKGIKMNNEVEWNTQVTKIHHTKYVRNTRAITVAWFVFCACYTILNIVAFIQPFWFGDTNESPGVGYFGVYEWCERVQGSDYRCEGDFLDFNTIKNDYFRASSFLIGLPILLFMLSIICMLLFLFLKARIVLRICGSLQLVAGKKWKIFLWLYDRDLPCQNNLKDHSRSV